MKDPLQKWQFVIVSWINCLKLPGISITSLRELQDNTIFQQILACFKPPIDCLETFLNEKYSNVHINYGLNLCDEEITLLSSLLMSHCCLDSDDEFKSHVITNMNSLNHDLQTAIKCFLEMFIENQNGLAINRDTLTQVILDSIPHITTESVPAASCPVTPHYSRTLETPRKRCASETQVDIPVIDHDKLMAECHRKINNLEQELDSEQVEKLEIKGRLKTEQENNKRLVQKYKEKFLEVQKLRDEIAVYENKSSTLEVGKASEMKILMDEKDSLEVYVTTLLNDISQLQDERDILENKLKQVKERVSTLETTAEESERAAEKMILDLEKNKIDINDLQERILDQERYIKGMKPELNVSVECDSLMISSYFSPTKVPDETPLSHTVVDVQIREKDILIHDLKKQLSDLNANFHELFSSHQLVSAENQCLKDSTCKLEVLLEENKTQFAGSLLAVKQHSQELLVLQEKLDLTESDLYNSKMSNKSLSLNCDDFQLKLKNAEECSKHQKEHVEKLSLTISLLKTNLEKQIEQAAIAIDDISMLKNKLHTLGKELNKLMRKACGILSCTSDAVSLEETDHVEPAFEHSDENSFETDLEKLNAVLSEIGVQKKELNQQYFDLVSVCEDKETLALNLKEEVVALSKKEREILQENVRLGEIIVNTEQNMGSLQRLMSDKEKEICMLRNAQTKMLELLNEVESKFEESRNNNSSLKELYDTLKSSSEAELLALTSQFAALKTEKDWLDLELENLQKNLSSLSHDKDDLLETLNQAKLDGIKTVEDMANTIVMLNEKIETLLNSNQLYCKELESMKQLHSEITASKASLSIICEQNSRKNEVEINKLNDQIQSTEMTISELKSERDLLKTQFIAVNNNFVDEQNKSDKLDKMYREAIQDRDDISLNLNNQVFSLQSSIEQLQSEKASTTCKLDSTIMRVAELGVENEKLAQEHIVLKEEFSLLQYELHAKEAELEQSRASIESLILKTVDLEKQNCDTESVLNKQMLEISRLSEDKRVLGISLGEVEQLFANKTDEVIRLGVLISDTSELLLKTKGELEQSLRDIDTLNKRYCTFQAHSDAEMLTLSTEIVALKSEKASLDLEVVKCQNNLASLSLEKDALLESIYKTKADSETTLSKMNTNVATLKEEVSNLKHSNQLSCQELQSVKTLLGETAASKVSLSLLCEQVTRDSEGKIHSLANQIQTIEKVVSMLTSERDLLQADVTLLSKSIIDEKNKSEKLDETYQKIIQDNDEISKNLNNQILSLQSSISQMQNEKEYIANDLNAANTKLTELTETYRKLSQELKDEITQVHATLQSREADLELLRVNIESLTVTCNDVEEKRSDAEELLIQKNAEITVLFRDKDVLSLKLCETLKSLSETEIVSVQLEVDKTNTEEMLKKTTTNLAECVKDKNNLTDCYTVLKSTYEDEQSLLVSELVSFEDLTEKLCVPSAEDDASNLQKILYLIKASLVGSLNILSGILISGNILVDPEDTQVLMSSTIAVNLVKFRALISSLETANVFATLEALRAQWLINQTLAEEELMKSTEELSLAKERGQAILLDNNRLEECCKAASESIASLHRANSEMVSDTQRLIGEKDFTLEVLHKRNLTLVSDLARLSALCFGWEEVCRKLANFETNLDPKLECIIAMRNQLDDKLSDIQHKFASIVVENVTDSDELDRIEVLKTTIDSIIASVEEQHSSISLVLFKCIYSSLQCIQMNVEKLKTPNAVDPCVYVSQLIDVDDFQDVNNQIDQLQLNVAGLLSQMAVTSNDICNLQKICPATSATAVLENCLFFDDSLELVQEIPALVNSSNQRSSIIQKVLESVENTHIGIRKKMKEFKAENMSLLESKVLDIKSLEGTIVKQNQEVATLKKDYTKLVNDCSEAQSTVVELRARLALQEQELEHDRHLNKELKKKMAACYSEADLETQVTRLGAEYEKKLTTAKASMIEIYSQKMSKLEPVRQQRDELEVLCTKYTDKILHYESFTKRQNEEMKKMKDILKREIQEKKVLLIKYSELKERAVSQSAVSTDPLVAKQNDVMEQLRYRGQQFTKSATGTQVLEARHIKEDPDNSYALVQNDLMEQLRYRGQQFTKSATQVIEAHHIKEDPDDSYAVVQRHSAKTKSINHNISQAFTTADEEGEVFNNTYLADLKAGPVHNEKGRLDELQYRNSLCLPHLKSSYPAETQFHDPRAFKDDDIKMGFNSDVDQSDCSSLNALLLPGERHRKKDRGQTSYQKPGPPTPVKNGGHRSFQGDSLLPRGVLQDHNADNIAAAVRGKLTTTPGRIRSLFSSSKGKRDENSPQTPRRRLSIFRKSVRGRDEA